MNKKIFVLSIYFLLFSCTALLAQNWKIGGNTLDSNSKFGSTNKKNILFIADNKVHAILNKDGLWGFGTSSPNTKVNINSEAGENPFRVQINGASKLYVDNGGGVSVGSSAIPPVNGLYVEGSLGIGTFTPGNRFHVKQSIANRAIEFEHESNSNFWTVGIGTSTLNCRFEFNGTGKAQISSTDGAYSQISDIRLKEEIEPISVMLDKIMKLKPSSYFYKDSRSYTKNKSIGFIAQDVEKVFPELVRDEDKGYKWLNYAEFSVIAIKGIQEQQKIITTLEERIAKLESALDALTAKTFTGTDLSEAALEQNTPNPFNQNTVIRYHLPKNISGQINIYDSNGQLMKTFNANESGQLTLYANDLKAGNYNYTLMIKGKVAASKKLVLLK